MAPPHSISASFTIPIGLFLALHAGDRRLTALFGEGKSAGAAAVMPVPAIAGVVHCLIFRGLLKRYHYRDRE